MDTNNTSLVIRESIKEKLFQYYLPFQLTFEVTPICNFRCKMCYVRMDREDQQRIAPLLDKAQLLDIAKQAFDAGTLSIGFTGGEIFTRNDFREIYEAVYDMGFYINILSNGSLIDENVINWLSKRKPYLIKITLYGCSNDTYERVCGIKNGFTTVTKNIRALRDAGINVMVSMTVIRENEADLEGVQAWVLSENLPFVYADVIRAPVRGAKSNALQERILSSQSCTLQFDKDRAYERRLYNCTPGKPFSSCRCYKSTAIVSWRGDLLGCNFINSISANAIDEPLVEQFRLLWDKLDAIKQPLKCQTCEYLQYCNPCPGSLEGESGNPEEISDYVCQKAVDRFIRRNANQDAINDESFTIEVCE